MEVPALVTADSSAPPTYHETLTSPSNVDFALLDSQAAQGDPSSNRDAGLRRRGSVGTRRRGGLVNKQKGPVSAYAHLGWPEGCFVLRNQVADRVLEVQDCKAADGTPLILNATAKRPQLTADLSLLHPKNNQLFYVDWTGYLTSASAGRPLDCTVDFGISIRHPSPIGPLDKYTCLSTPHPPTRFRYDYQTKTIHCIFEFDPHQTEDDIIFDDDDDEEEEDSSPPTPDPHLHWKEKDYILESVPLRRPPLQPPPPSPATLALPFGLGALPLFPFRSPTAATFGFSVTQPESQSPTPQPPSSPNYNPQYITPTAQPAIPQHAMLQPVTPNSRTVFDISAPPIPSSSRELTGAAQDPRTDEVDDSPSNIRAVRIVALQPGWREKFEKFENSEIGRSPGRISEEEEREMMRWRRRKWDCVAVVVQSEGERQAALLKASAQRERAREREMEARDRQLHVPNANSGVSLLRHTRSESALSPLNTNISTPITQQLSPQTHAQSPPTPASGKRRPAALKLSSPSSAATTPTSASASASTSSVPVESLNVPQILTMDATPVVVNNENSSLIKGNKPVEVVVQEVGQDILQGIGELVSDARQGVRNALR